MLAVDLKRLHEAEECVHPMSCIIASVKYGVYEGASPQLEYLINASIIVQYIGRQMSNCHTVFTTCLCG